MTEIPAEPIDPTAPTLPDAPRRSRRGLIIGIAGGLVLAIAVGVGVVFALTVLNAKAVALYTSEAEQYSVMAPGTPTQDEALAGALATTVTHWTDGDLYYSVSSTEPADVPPSQRGLVLHELLTGALKHAPGVGASDLESSAVADAFLAQPDQITLSGDPAFLTEVTVDGAPATFHIVLAGRDRSLYVLVYSDAEDSSDEDFLESFTFLD
jgi:hypothetical protein